MNLEFIEELKYEANLLYLKETPLGLRLITMESLREEVEYLRNENKILRSMLECSISAGSDSCRYCGRNFCMHDVSIQNSLSELPTVGVISNQVSLAEIENVQQSEEEKIDMSALINADNDPELPLSSIEQLLDASTVVPQKNRQIAHVPTISSVTLDFTDERHSNRMNNNDFRNEWSIDSHPEFSSPIPAVQQPPSLRTLYRLQLQQHVNRMHRATKIRAAAVQSPLLHPDDYQLITNEEQQPETSSGPDAPFSPNQDHPGFRSKQKPITEMPVVTREKRTKQISQAYSAAPYVLRPATRTPSRHRRKPKSKSRSHSRRRPKNNAEKKPRSRSPSDDNEIDVPLRINNNNDYEIEHNEVDHPKHCKVVENYHSTSPASSASPRRSKSPSFLPKITPDMSATEKIAAEIIHKVRTGNGRIHRHEVRKKLSPSEIMLLNSPFAKPIIPTKRLSPSPGKKMSPVPPNHKPQLLRPGVSAQSSASPRAKFIVERKQEMNLSNNVEEDSAENFFGTTDLLAKICTDDDNCIAVVPTEASM
jgi:hypothetical protein